MPQPKKMLNDDEIDKVKRGISHHIPLTEIAASIGISVNTLRARIKELQVMGVIGSINTQSKGRPKKEETDDDTDPEEKEDPVIKPTKDMFVSKAKQVLSDDMVKELKDRLSAAQVLKDAEYMFRKNIEAMRFNWQEWVQYALQRTYEDTLEWYEEEGGNMTLEELMEIATEMETAKAFVEGAEA